MERCLDWQLHFSANLWHIPAAISISPWTGYLSTLSHLPTVKRPESTLAFDQFILIVTTIYRHR